MNGKNYATLEDGTDNLSRNVGKIITTPRCVISQRSEVFGKIMFTKFNQLNYRGKITMCTRYI